jgi:hypothetical protein
MAKVVREMVEKAGINVDELLELPVKNAAAELTTCYDYTILRANLIGSEGVPLARQGPKSHISPAAFEQKVFSKREHENGLVCSKNKTAPKRFPHRDSDNQLERELIANNQRKGEDTCRRKTSPRSNGQLAAARRTESGGPISRT